MLQPHRSPFSYKYHQYDCWIEDHLRNQMRALQLFPHENFLRALTTTEACFGEGDSSMEVLRCSFGDIVWVPRQNPDYSGPFSVNLTRVLAITRAPWSPDFFTTVARAYQRACELRSADLHTVCQHFATTLKCTTSSSDLIGRLPKVHHWAALIGLFDPRTCHMRRSIVITGAPNVQKEIVLKYVWKLAPDVFTIPSATLGWDTFIEETVEGYNWPLVCSEGDTSPNHENKHKANPEAAKKLQKTPSGLKADKKKTGTALTNEMMSLARTTLRSGRIPILIVALSFLQDWRSSAELAPFVVLLKSHKAKHQMPSNLEHVDYCVINEPRYPSKMARDIVVAFSNLNNAEGSEKIPWKPATWCALHGDVEAVAGFPSA